MPSPIYPAAAAIAAFMVLMPLPALRRTCNIAVLVGTTCVFFSCIIYVVNTIVWAGNVRDVAPVWCDITTNFWMYSQFSMEFAALCICKDLEWITSPRSSGTKRTNRVFWEVILCCIVPLISVPIRYALSTNRYTIFEDWGCLPAIYPSELSVAIIFGPQVGICLHTFLYACLAVRNIIRRRAFHSSRSPDSNSALTTPRFIRLLILCPFIGICPGIIVCFILRIDFAADLQPWTGWAAIHSTFSQIDTKAMSDQSASLRRMTLVVYWVYIINAYILAIILASSEDVRGAYYKAWISLTHKLSCRRSHHKTGKIASTWPYSTAKNNSTYILPAMSGSDLPHHLKAEPFDPSHPHFLSSDSYA